MLDSLTAEQLQTLNLALLAWGVAVGLILWNIVEDVVAAFRNHEPSQRRRVECAPGRHDYSDGASVCRTCKAVKPLDDSTD